MSDRTFTQQEEWKQRLVSYLQWLLRGSKDTRVRASWRILIAVVLTFVGAFSGSLVVQRLNPPDLFTPVVVHSLAVGAVFVTVWLLARYVDHRPISEYGFAISSSWLTDAIVGLCVGVMLVALAFGVSYQRGYLIIRDTFSTGSADAIVFGFAVVAVGWVFVSVWEETLFRGLFLKNAAEGLGTRVGTPLTATFGAWLSSSVVYGFVHGPLGSNPDEVSLLYALLMTSVMGGLFGVAYLLSGELALPMGLHTGINLAEHNFFFGPPSGSAPAVVRAEHAVTGAHVQFQSISPSVIIPVFISGYLVICGWIYLRMGELSLQL